MQAKQRLDSADRLARVPSTVRDAMRFHLVYNGLLPSSGNRSKLSDVTRLRRELSPQMQYLWETHPALSLLQDQGVIHRPGAPFIISPGHTPRELSVSNPESFQYLGEPLSVGAKSYTPLVRKSLDLTCELSILFLRQQDPGQLVTQGGDLDGRIKTLLDALRMPSPAEQNESPPEEDHLFCLMEQDALAAGLDIRTDRLLFPQSGHQHEVHLVIEVSVNVLRVGPHNLCLV